MFLCTAIHLPNIFASLVIVFVFTVESREQPPVVPLGRGQAVKPLPVPRPFEQPVALRGLLKGADKKNSASRVLRLFEVHYQMRCSLAHWLIGSLLNPPFSRRSSSLRA